ncbi:MAG: cell division protein ZapD [Neisseria sp.]|nr:cell division protein ZapD [Neisseria sp.]
MIRFEHPLSERVRNFLRIEYLFNRFQEEIVQNQSVWSHHLALFTLFEIMECAARAELKLDILQEVERQRQLLQRTHDKQSAEELQDKLKQVAAGLQGIQQKFGQHLRENEWLMAIKQRMPTPGGTSPFDLPSYYFWQQSSYESRLADLQKWIGTLMPTYDAISVLLGILRSNTRQVACTAQAGNYQHPSLAQNIHMLSIEVETSHQVMPEVSANKYFTHIRFLDISQERSRGPQTKQDIPFKMIMCSFDSVIE